MDYDLTQLIADHAHELRTHDGIDKVALLRAIAEVESDSGARRLAALHEPAYCYGGFYYKSPNGEDLRRLSKIYGCLAHCSYSSWQILFLAAYEEGFRNDPTALRNDAEAVHWVVRFLNRRILDRYPRILIDSIADAYNSGRPYDANRPDGYIRAFVEAYERHAAANS
jgi:hypothetical protein